MTSEAYRKIEELFPPEKAYMFAKEICDASKFDPKYFKKSSDSEILSAARRRLYVGKTINLLTRAVFMSGITSDIIRISQHLLVLLDRSDELDYKKSETENDIRNLENKYSRKEFLALEIEPEDIEEWVKKGGGYLAAIKGGNAIENN